MKTNASFNFRRLSTIVSIIFLFIILASCEKEENTHPVAAFDILPDSGTVETVFTFDASASSDAEDEGEYLEARWDWQNDAVWDSDWSTNMIIERQYSNAGTYSITLEIKDSKGLKNSITKELKVKEKHINSPPIAAFSIDPPVGYTTTVFQFDASASNDQEDAMEDLMFRWDFEGDGSWDTGWISNPVIEYQYTTGDSFQPKVEVKDTEGATGNNSKSLTVVVDNYPPVAAFSVEPGTGTPLTVFTFDAEGSQDEEDPYVDLQVRWDFEGDGNWDTDWSSEKTQVHQFASLNTYSIKLQVKDTEGLTGSSSHTVIISNDGGAGTFTDPRDGKEYKTVVIGGQTWFAESLNYASETSGCYDNDEENCSTYGRLYLWEVALDVCPPGWHLPSNEEWCELTRFIDGTAECEMGNIGADVGYKLKSSTGWNFNGNGSDVYGFNALPGGRGSDFNNQHQYKGFHVGFWSSTAAPPRGLRWGLESSNSFINLSSFGVNFTHYIRCVKD